MIGETFRDHPAAAVIVLAALSFIVGLIEHLGFGRTDLASVTWLFGVITVSAAVASFEWLGLLRWPLAVFLLVAGSLVIVTIYRRR